MLRTSHKVVLALQDLSGSNGGRIINISGRQRMLSQRIAMLHALSAWGLEDAEVREELDRARSEFHGAQMLLKKSRLSTRAIHAELENVNALFNDLEALLDASDKKQSLAGVAQQTDSILKKMNRVTGLYQEAVDKL